MSDVEISAVNHHAASIVVSAVDASGTSSRAAEESPSQPQHHSKNVAQHAHFVDIVSGNPAEIPLPSDLKRLLQEVAKTGACPWLSWDQEMSVSEPPSTLALGAASKRSAAIQSFPKKSQGPPRKKHRNGVHKTSRRKTSETQLKTSSSRKRPLGFVRTTPSAVATNSSNISSAPSSVGSGRTSGSEPEDSTHYECDSEGTSTTSNSEISVERLRKSQFLQQQSQIRRTSIASLESSNESTFPYKTLQEAFRTALGTVLDHFYKHRGGYKLSPAEKRWNETLVVKWSNDKKTQSAEAVFQQRRQRLLHMLDSDVGTSFQRHDSVVSSSGGPPFTIQRIAEVLLSPDRYYTQTHKLCNCLEKLLLVRSSSEAFGGSTGGDTSQSRREEREMAALADEKGRQDSELRQRRLRMRVPSPTSDNSDSAHDGVIKGGAHRDDGTLNDNGKRILAKDKKPSAYETHDDHQRKKDDASEETTREQLEAAARASLRTKFDHVGIDPHHHHSQDRDALSMGESRRMTNSPPPPSLATPPAPTSIGLQGHPSSPGYSRQHLPDQAAENHLARVPSPILFSPGNETSIHAAAAAASTNMHMLQIQHAVALSGVTLGRGTTSALELMTIDGTMRQHSNLASSVDNADGRSSTSNSDVDSESDDISLDDSASDRSDGSDSGSVTHYEPFTAARAMALNRMQQQQRLQSRVLTSMNMQQAAEGFRLPVDSEYQSGDSIDSTRAEDSGGSDSSSSDMAD